MKTTATATATWIGDVRAITYPIQFELDPNDGVDRVVDQITAKQSPDERPEQILTSVRQALASDLDLSQLLPQDHSDNSCVTISGRSNGGSPAIFRTGKVFLIRA